MELKVGDREPTVKHDPVGITDYEDAYDACELASRYGMEPDPWQRDIIKSWLGRKEDGSIAAKTAAVSVPRQNGKNALIEFRSLYGSAILGERILHTAHQLKTARKAFERIKEFFNNERMYPELFALVKNIRMANGQEAIFLKNGGCIEFVARTRQSARGFSVDVLMVDEAQELTDEQQAAIMSTASTSGDPQIIYVGTPPDLGAEAEVFKRIRKDGLEGTDSTLSYYEWSVSEIGDIHDESRWYATNPSLGIRLNHEFVKKECRTMSPEVFARERLGWWAKKSNAKIFSENEWNALAVSVPPSDGKTTFGVKFSPDDSFVAISACKREKRGKPHVEVIKYQSCARGVTWIADFLDERKDKVACVMVDGLGAATNLKGKLEDLNFPEKAFIRAKTEDMVTSTAMFENAVTEGELTHFDQEALNDSVTCAIKRSIGKKGAYAFGSTADGDSLPIESAALAMLCNKKTKRNPGRRQVIL